MTDAVDEATCRSCAMLKTMVESGRITDPVLAGQAALTTRRSLERDRAIERAEKAEARVIEMVEQTDTIPGTDFREQMEFNRKRYEGACARADEATARARAAEDKVKRVLAAARQAKVRDVDLLVVHELPDRVVEICEAS